MQQQAKPAIGQPMQRQASATMQDINPNALSRDQVQKIQQALDKSGFGAGRTDGVWGPETQAALQKFQKSKAMSTANGQLDRTTLSALQLNPNQFAPGPGYDERQYGAAAGQANSGLAKQNARHAGGEDALGAPLLSSREKPKAGGIPPAFLSFAEVTGSCASRRNRARSCWSCSRTDRRFRSFRR